MDGRKEDEKKICFMPSSFSRQNFSLLFPVWKIMKWRHFIAD